MAGIGHVLSIAKEALLTHQLSIQVASHNIANVDTPGYTRQSLQLETHNATPISSGMLGGGVKGTSILRNYDQFMVQRLANQESTLGSLEAQQQSMRLVETVFNEAPGLAINDLMNQFWSSWQELADNPEISATRQQVVQSSQLIIDQLHTMTGELTQAKFDIGISLDTAIEDVNSIVTQIADLNVQISGAESAAGEANDMRDKRDGLVRELSQLLDVSFFEDKNGAYTILMADGHTLVESNQSWQVDWENNELIWVNKDSNGLETRRPIGGGAELGGKIGGWLEVRGNLVEGDPNNFLGRLDAFANAMIREINQQHSQGVGLTMFSDALTGSAQAKDVARLTATIDPITANLTIAPDSITINNRAVGEIIGGTPLNGLATIKAYNAVTAINTAATDVTARLTTQMAGSLSVDASNIQAGDIISLTVNGVAVNYTVVGGVGGDLGDNAAFATHLAAEITSDLSTYNGLATTSNPVTIKATAGTGSNGGVANSLVFYNENEGDGSSITVDNLNITLFAAGPATIADLGLATVAGNTYTADATHNTGKITLFSTNTFTLKAGATDSILAQLGLTGTTVSSFDTQTGDGSITYGPEVSSQGPLLPGFDYFDELDTSGSFDIWVYNTDGSLALPQPVTVSLERAYDLNGVVRAINTAMTNAGAVTGGTRWVEASPSNASLRLTPDTNHQFVFANDTSNLLQVAGLNTFFTGSSAATIGVNSVITNNFNNLAAGTVGAQGQIFSGDNTNSLKITSIQHDETIKYTGGAKNTLDGFYNTLVGQVANTTRTISRTYDSTVLVNNQVSEMRDSVSGVSLDEEMANLVKYQHAYTAAARLITMSDEMLQTLLDSVR
ncbi:flagellar hook-associated protein FlgK [Thiovibrio frasassiensis]|uniref:Flagellar hook-associated protein 1 n=1 Tax=Thiovibrio frasassiensis TaxID=2984131 RepID=A0A9X4RL88_9BACT|nr:flagellar hook-associated protein FlgK [Thiovibrio frasassiensis]MDG4475836.1 flagellar hook-associated protein FlgK [Thiovibrio frasassiensis]